MLVFFRFQAPPTQSDVGGFAVVLGAGCPRPISSIQEVQAFPDQLVQVSSIRMVILNEMHLLIIS